MQSHTNQTWFCLFQSYLFHDYSNSQPESFYICLPQTCFPYFISNFIKDGRAGVNEPSNLISKNRPFALQMSTCPHLVHLSLTGSELSLQNKLINKVLFWQMTKQEGCLHTDIYSSVSFQRTLHSSVFKDEFSCMSTHEANIYFPTV